MSVKTGRNNNKVALLGHGPHEAVERCLLRARTRVLTPPSNVGSARFRWLSEFQAIQSHAHDSLHAHPYCQAAPR